MAVMHVGKGAIKHVIKLAMDMGKRRKGSLIVLSPKDIRRHYSLLYGRFIRPFRISEKMYPVLESLSSLDGAIIVVGNEVVDAGAKIRKTKTFPGHGTRHSAGLGISTIPGVISVLSSEEDGMVRVFKEGRLVMEINPSTGEEPTLLDRIASLLSKKEVQILGSGGIASVALGLNPFVATLIFAGSYIVTQYGIANLEEFLKAGKIIVRKAGQKGGNRG